MHVKSEHCVDSDELNVLLSRLVELSGGLQVGRPGKANPRFTPPVTLTLEYSV
jgi:hypothetical protein